VPGLFTNLPRCEVNSFRRRLSTSNTFDCTPGEASDPVHSDPGAAALNAVHVLKLNATRRLLGSSPGIGHA
jgi:hypothetical protein